MTAALDRIVAAVAAIRALPKAHRDLAIRALTGRTTPKRAPRKSAKRATPTKRAVRCTLCGRKFASKQGVATHMTRAHYSNEGTAEQRSSALA